MGFADSPVSPWFSSGTVTSSEARYAMAAPFSKGPTSAIQGEPGVIPSSVSPFNLTSNGTASFPSVAVGAGQCVVVNAIGGTYVCTNPSSLTVTLETPLPAGSNTRRDLLCARVIDQETGDGSGLEGRLRLETVTGTSATSPSTPTAPPGYLPLWIITVNSSGALSFSDVRTYTRAVGGLRFVRSGDTRDGSHQGDTRIFGTGQIDIWTGTAWLTIVSPAVWSQVDVNLTYAGNGGSVPQGTVALGTGGFMQHVCRYKRTGNDLQVSYSFWWSRDPANAGYNGGVGPITTTLPNGWTSVPARDHWLQAQLWVNQPGNVFDVQGLALIQSNSNIVRPYFPYGGPIIPYKIADSIGVPGHSVPLVNGGFAQGGTLHISGLVELSS